MSRVKVGFSNFFNNFLGQFEKDEAKEIKDRIVAYANDEEPLPIPAPCPTISDYRFKILIPDLKVVVYYDDFGDHWKVQEGDRYFPRAA